MEGGVMIHKTFSFFVDNIVKNERLTPTTPPPLNM